MWRGGGVWLFDILLIELVQQDQAYPRVTERQRQKGSCSESVCSVDCHWHCWLCCPLTPDVLLDTIAPCQQRVEMNVWKSFMHISVKSESWVGTDYLSQFVMTLHWKDWSSAIGVVRSWQYSTWCWAAERGSHPVQPLQLGLEENELHTMCSWVCYTSWLYGHGCTLTTSAVLFASLESLALFLCGAVLNTSVIPICTTVH